MEDKSKTKTSTELSNPWGYLPALGLTTTPCTWCACTCMCVCIFVCGCVCILYHFPICIRRSFSISCVYALLIFLFFSLAIFLFTNYFDVLSSLFCVNNSSLILYSHGLSSSCHPFVPSSENEVIELKHDMYYVVFSL